MIIKKLKDPDAKLDYLFRFTDELDAVDDTIASFQIVAQDGITISSSTNTSTEVKVWISGGTLGQSYLVTCRITTTAGRIYDKSFYMHIDNM